MPDGAVASKVGVDANQVGEIAAGDFRRSVVEKLGFDAPLCKHARWMLFRIGVVQELHKMEFAGCGAGWIEAICGPMFSGKSEELIRRLRRALIARRLVQVFKPSIDDRYSKDEIVTHDAVRMRSESVGSADQILEKLDWKTQVIGIDEANFFGQPLVELADRLADDGKRVIIAGLDTDYMGRPFAPMPDLLAIAESITKTLAICVRCGNPAKHTQRLVDSDQLILVGADGAYEARCRCCFEPGSPKQETLDFAEPAQAFVAPHP